ncbi:MAG: sugar transferase [Chitinophagaceae bacterium]
MDSALLPKNPSALKKYKHFTINSHPESNTVADGEIEFFYIGKNTAKINFLVQTFKSGYAADNVQKAISILNRIADKAVIPDFIIVDQAIGELSIQEINRFITDSVVFSSMPLVLDASGLSKNDLEKYRTLHSLDEIIFLAENSKEKLVSKIEFLKKLKRNNCGIAKWEMSQRTPLDFLESKNLLKRLFDIVISFLVITLLSPVFLLIAIAIKLESKGPVLYVSKRAGKGYRIFNFYKFRTMVLDADKNVQQLSHLNHYNDHNENGQVFFKVVNDSRITRVGTFLRSTSMDELPQFFNVLSGKMSLVGNRPLPLYEAVKLTTDDWAERFMAPAGITGLWQIKKGEKGSMSMEERINLDIAYSQRYNFMYDLWIMANTPLALIQKSNT